MEKSTLPMFTLPLRNVYFHMLREGCSPGDLLAGSEISEADMDEPYCVISSAQAQQFYRNTVFLGQKGVGLEIGYATKLTDMGLRGLSYATAKTFRDALSESLRGFPYYYMQGSHRVKVFEKVMVHYLSALEEEDEALSTFLLERGIGLIQANMEELCGARCKPERLLLHYPKPTNFRRYERIFCCPILFDQPGTEMHYSTKYLDHKIETHDPIINRMLITTREALQTQLVSRTDLAQDVTQYLREQKGELPKLEQVAEHFSVSPRGLRRKLAAQEVSFQQLLDIERRRIAEYFLRHTTESISNIGYRMGYNQPQNFSQTFKRWTGMTPREYRQSDS